MLSATELTDTATIAEITGGVVSTGGVTGGSSWANARKGLRQHKQNDHAGAKKSFHLSIINEGR